MRAFPLVLLAAAALNGSCGGSDSGFTNATQATETLVGSWRATKVEYTNRSNTTQKLDIVARGSTVTLVLEGGGTFRLTIADPGLAGNVVSGTWTATRDVLTIVTTGQNGETQFDMTLSGSTLALNGGHVLFDVNSDGAGEECVLEMSLVRASVVAPLHYDEERSPDAAGPRWLVSWLSPRRSCCSLSRGRRTVPSTARWSPGP